MAWPMTGIRSPGAKMARDHQWQTWLRAVMQECAQYEQLVP